MSKKNHLSVLLCPFEVRSSEGNILSSESPSENKMSLERSSRILKSSKKILKEKMYKTFQKSKKIEILSEIRKKILSRHVWQLQNDLHSFENLLDFLIENSNFGVKEIIREALLKQVFFALSFEVILYL